MTRKNAILITVAVLLAAIYGYFFTDWFVTPRIQIISQVRPFKPSAGGAAVHPINLAPDGTYKLSLVKVVPLEAYLTNKFASAVWHLVSVSPTNSAPVRGFMYGKLVPGMKLAESNSPPKTLEPDRKYRLFIQSGKAKGEIDFSPSGPGASHGVAK